MARRYVPVWLQLSKPQRIMLSRRGQARVKGARRGPHKTYLTRTQARHVMAGRGFIIRMSPTQHGINIRHGGGFWDTIRKGAKSLAGKYRPELQKLAHQATHALGRKINQYIPGAGDVARKNLYKLGRDYFDKTIQGGRIRRLRRTRRRNRRVRGRGFWDSIKSGFNSVWNPIVSGARDIAPIAAELAPYFA